MNLKKMKTGMTVLALLLIFTLGGCTNVNEVISPEPSNPSPSESPFETDTTPPQGITVNDIKFEIPEMASLSEEIKNLLPQLTSERGFYYWVDDQGVFTLFVGMGEKPTGGYSIEVTSIEDNEGMTNVFVKEITPEKDQMVTEALTYPYVIVRMQGVTDRFMVTNSDNEAYESLLLDEDSAIVITGVYQGQIDNNSIEVKTGDSYMVFRNSEMVLLTGNYKKDDLVKITYVKDTDGSNQLRSIEPVK